MTVASSRVSVLILNPAVEDAVGSGDMPPSLSRRALLAAVQLTRILPRCQGGASTPARTSSHWRSRLRAAQAIELEPRHVLASRLSAGFIARNRRGRVRDVDPKSQHEICRPHISHAKCLFSPGTEPRPIIRARSSAHSRIPILRFQFSCFDFPTSLQTR